MTMPQIERELASYTAASPAPAPGRFVWHDLMSTEPAAARAFYGALFGWTTTESAMPDGTGTYTMLRAGDVAIGGIVPLGASRMDTSHGIASHWIGYCTVPDVDAACARAAALGGAVCCAPFDLPGIGRMAVVGDPSRAVFSPFAYAREESPEPVGPAPLESFCWDELLTDDVEGAARFYAALLGWTVETREMGTLAAGQTGVYHLCRRGAVYAAGMMRMPDEAGAPPCWLPYIAVARVDERARRVTALGGTIHVPPTDIPDVGRFAVTADPTGAAFGMLEAGG